MTAFAVAYLQMKSALTRSDVGLYLFSLSKRPEQSLRLGDLRHFQRRRKAFERGRERVVPFDRAAGRLVELGEQQRGAQFEAARSLPARDVDRGPERPLGARGVAGIALQQYFAARSAQLRFERAKANAVGRRQRFIEKIARARLTLAHTASAWASTIFRWHLEHQNALFAPQEIDAATHALETAKRPAFIITQPLKKRTKCTPHVQVAITRETGQFDSVRRSAAW